jgi:hypothetical protein
MTQQNSRRWIAHLLYLSIALSKVFDMYRDKYKQAQTLPLKEDFRQVPDQVTGQVFQTT